jgi:hypothetical protein
MNSFLGFMHEPNQDWQIDLLQEHLQINKNVMNVIAFAIKKIIGHNLSRTVTLKLYILDKQHCGFEE